jgi:long-chain acyl-CoA synthetase
VFAGYYKDPEATAESLVDGWLYSGDLGSFDDDGFLTITGRKKDIIITAGGENVTPSLIEIELKKAPIIAEAVVVGDARPYLTALIAPDPEAAEELGLDAAGVREAVQKAVDEANQGLASVRQIKRFTILDRPLSIDGGELTPTLKVKRGVVKDHFSAEINGMYR